jgi:biopolymer transport protein ExbB/TolQ
MDFNPVEIWGHMSWIVKFTLIFMGLMSVFAVFASIERYITFRKASQQTYSYVLALRDYLAKRRIDDALKAAKLHKNSPVANVVASGLSAYKSGREALEEQGPEDVGEFDLVDSVNRALERVKERETSGLRKWLGGLGTVAAVSPFVGLFGTCFGTIHAFGVIKGGGGMDVIGPAIAEALYATAIGIGVAIYAAIFFNYFTTRVEQMVVDMDDVSSEFIDFVLKEGRS